MTTQGQKLDLDQIFTMGAYALHLALNRYARAVLEANTHARSTGKLHTRTLTFELDRYNALVTEYLAECPHYAEAWKLHVVAVIAETNELLEGTK